MRQFLALTLVLLLAAGAPAQAAPAPDEAQRLYEAIGFKKQQPDNEFLLYKIEV